MIKELKETDEKALKDLITEAFIKYSKLLEEDIKKDNLIKIETIGIINNKLSVRLYVKNSIQMNAQEFLKHLVSFSDEWIFLLVYTNLSIQMAFKEKENDYNVFKINFVEMTNQEDVQDIEEDEVYNSSEIWLSDVLVMSEELRSKISLDENVFKNIIIALIPYINTVKFINETRQIDFPIKELEKEMLRDKEFKPLDGLDTTKVFKK